LELVSRFETSNSCDYLIQIQIGKESGLNAGKRAMFIVVMKNGAGL